MTQLEDLRALQQAAIGRYHAIQGEFAKELAKTHFAEQIAAVDTANRVITTAGFATDLRLWFHIEYQAPETWPYLCCSLQGMRSDGVLRIRLSDAEREACVANKAEAEVAWREYSDFGRQVNEAEAAQARARKPLKSKQLLALVSSNHGEQEQYYIDNGPRKHDQEDYTGMQVIQMNLDLLAGWLGDAGEDFERLPANKRHKIWEASGFHFGINGYTEADAEHYWQQEAGSS